MRNTCLLYLLCFVIACTENDETQHPPNLNNTLAHHNALQISFNNYYSKYFFEDSIETSKEISNIQLDSINKNLNSVIDFYNYSKPIQEFKNDNVQDTLTRIYTLAAIGEDHLKNKVNIDSSRIYYLKAYNLITHKSEYNYEKYWVLDRLIYTNLLLERYYIALNYCNKQIDQSSFGYKYKAKAKLNKCQILFRFGLYDETRKQLKELKYKNNIDICERLNQEIESLDLIIKIIEGKSDSTKILRQIDEMSKNIEQCSTDHTNIERWKSHYFMRTQETEKVIESLEKSITHIHNRKPLNRVYFQNQTDYLSKALLDKNKFEQSLNYTYSSTKNQLLSQFDYSDFIQEIKKDNDFAFYKSSKASDIFLKWYLFSSAPEHIKKAEELFHLSIELMRKDKIPNHEEAIYLFLSKRQSLLNTGMQIYYQLYKLTRKQRHLHNFDYYNELSRYNKLVNVYNTKRIPDINSVRKEQTLESELLKLKLNAFNDNITLDRVLSEFKIRNKSTKEHKLSFFNDYEKDSLIDLQDNIVKSKNTLLIFEKIDSNIFIRYLGNSIDTLYKCRIDDKYLETSKYINSKIKKRSKIEPLFTESLHYLYKFLLPFQTFEQDRITYVISDPELNLLNIELLTPTNNSLKNDEQVDYLLHYATFINSPSFRYLKKNINEPISNTPKISAFSFSDNTTLENKSTKCSLPELNYTIKEIDIIKSYFPDASVFSGNLFTKDRILNELNNQDTDILHIATHSSASLDLRDNIQLYSRNHTYGCDTLFGFELLQNKIDNKLLVMSSCESSEGSYIKGEGVHSLNTYLLSAGASGTITADWQISDFATQRLFKIFYENLKYNSIENSLRDAKLQMIQDNLLAHPHYWAALKYSI